MNSVVEKIKTRTILSAACFGVFLASAIGIAVVGRSDFRYYVMVPFVVSYLLLPRRRIVPGEGTEAEMGRKVNLWLSYLRVIYFLAALFVLLALPKLIA